MTAQSATPEASPSLYAAAPAGRFVASVATYHLLTYVVAGLVASQTLDYAELLRQPVVREYYLPYDSVDVWLSGAAQLVRGALVGAVLLPLRPVLAASRWGWLWLWLVLVVIGVLGTPAAAPGSFEGLVYTRVPLWFHLVGLPEMLLQTLAFSVLVHRALRSVQHPLPPSADAVVRALVATCLGFVGYTVVSLGFALSEGADFSGGSDPRVLGQFVAPLLLTFAMAVRADRHWRRADAVLTCLGSTGALAAYQGLVLGGVGWLYVLLAPLVPVLLTTLLLRRGQTASAPRR